MEKALQAKGIRRRESHHRYFVYHTEEGIKTPVRTKTSHGRGGVDITDKLSSLMAKQCKLRKAEFRALVDCSLSQADYEKILTSNDEV